MRLGGVPRDLVSGELSGLPCCSPPSQPQSLRADAAGAEGKEVAQGESLPSRRRDWAPYSPPYPVASEPLRNSLSVLK